MLTKLSIKNYALIESLSVNFKDKLSIITGETGAGKSILLGALGLVLGKRADSATLKNRNIKCIIEAQFSIDNYFLESFFETNDIDFENETIIRREILPSGKSRAFINDTPTTLQVLQSLSEKLIDVHSQHQTLQLSNVNFQFKIIDALANNSVKIASYKRGLRLYNKLVNELNELKKNQELATEQYQYNLHLFEELEKANLLENEQELVEQSLDKLNNIEEIKQHLSEAQENSFNEDRGLKSLLTSIANNLHKISSFSNEYKELYSRILSIKIEFDDIAQEIENANEAINFDASELEQLNDRLQLIYNLQKKHAVSSITNLLSIQEELSIKVDDVENSSIIISKKEAEVKSVSDKINVLSNSIYKERKKAIPLLVNKLENILVSLGMENTRFQFNLTQSNQFFANGKDELNLLISANKGVNFGELKKVASGGELSRIMLSVKSILSEYLKLPTIIFDEIDNGVSGEIADKVGNILREMSESMQVIAITHLPQIAGIGLTHFKVYKETLNETTESRIISISQDDRVIVIAKMISGSKVSEVALENAKILLS